MPIALITFVDRDHQWFKSQAGLPEEIAEAQETSRELSVCGHVIANDELLVIEDLSRDRRFANNPLLKEHGLRFYADVPLRSNNLPIGSLCILDIKPRRMTEREKRLLEVIGEDVMEEIKRRDSVGSPSVLVAQAVITDAAFAASLGHAYISVPASLHQTSSVNALGAYFAKN